jgi:hypothetical protein
MIARAPAGLLLLVAAVSGTEASACFYNPEPYIGDKPSAAEQRARRKAESERRIRYENRQARRDWPGEAGAAAALADLLVPNIRPIHIEHSDCGPTNEIDLAEGEEMPDDLLAGTRYAGRAEEFPAIFRGYEGGTPGQLCNSEVRVRFAAHLRRRLSAETLREVYIFLRARRPDSDRIARMTAFEGRSRQPPLRWAGRDEWATVQVRRWLVGQAPGRALKAATDEFWSENAPLLADTRSACPAAADAWPAAQAALVEAMDAAEERRRAAREGKPAS